MKILIHLFSAAILCVPCLAQDARKILQEAQRRAKSDSQRYEGTLKVIGAENRITTKRWVYERLNSFAGARAVLRFTEPEDVKGVALLVIGRAMRASEQWMWRPEIGREQRIATQDRSTRFFGTDFSFEDLEERDADHFDLKLSGEENGAWKIEAKPKRESQYTHSLFWVNQKNYTLVKVEAFNAEGPVRIIQYRDFKQIGKIMTAVTTEAFDVARKSRTILTLDKVEYNVPISKDNLTLEYLRKQ